MSEKLAERWKKEEEAGGGEGRGGVGGEGEEGEKGRWRRSVSLAKEEEEKRKLCEGGN